MTEKQNKFKAITSASIDCDLDCDTCILNINSVEIGELYEYTKISY